MRAHRIETDPGDESAGNTDGEIGDDEGKDDRGSEIEIGDVRN